MRREGKWVTSDEETSDETRREEKIFSTGKRSGDASGIQKCKTKKEMGEKEERNGKVRRREDLYPGRKIGMERRKGEGGNQNNRLEGQRRKALREAGRGR